jgi:two-component system sensor histidine kinase UhpB
MRRLQNWGIAARLLAIIVLPASIMFIAVTVTIYITTLSDVRRDVADRGRLIATALAQSSQYGLVSGNIGYLRLTLRDLLKADPGIACIEIQDGDGRPVLADCRDRHPRYGSTHALPIQLTATPSLELFDPGSLPPVAQETAPAPARTIGHVRVTMSSAPILKAKQEDLLLAFALVLGAAVLSGLVGLQLARRLRHTLGVVMSALRSIRQGRFDVRLDTSQAGELGELQRTIVQMAETLHSARHELEQQVATRTRELQQAVKRVRQADDEKRRLITHSNAAVEDERKRIAVDIHDHLGAALISVRLEASAMAARARSMGDADLERDARHIASTAEGIYATTRNIVKSLRPEIIDTLGLSGAIEELVRNMDVLNTGCRFHFSAMKGLPYLRGEVAMPAYRITQEAINNIVKHAGATEARIGLTLAPDPHHLCIEISDNGRGFDAETGHAGLGLIGMRERVAAVAGQLDILSSEGKGTLIRVTLPLMASEAVGKPL